MSASGMSRWFAGVEVAWTRCEGRGKYTHDHSTAYIDVVVYFDHNAVHKYDMRDFFFLVPFLLSGHLHIYKRLLIPHHPFTPHSLLILASNVQIFKREMDAVPHKQLIIFSYLTITSVM